MKRWSCKDIKAADYSAIEAKHGGGYDIHEFQAAGYACAQAKEAGFTAKEIHSLRVKYALSDVKQQGYVSTLSEARAAGYNCSDAKDAGYSLLEVKRAGYRVGCSTTGRVAIVHLRTTHVL